MENIEWDGFQKKVIESHANNRIQVDAGPGTGKTLVACARVAWLIDKFGIQPANIWLISFTRTAVQEIHDRINEFLGNESVADFVKITTIDSLAWMIYSGFDSNARILGSYDENIKELIDKIRKNEDGISEYLHDDVQHLIIDEGQDIMGIRADLLLEVISRLSDQCGVTIFSDAAQAIYRFSLDDGCKKTQDGQKNLIEKIRDKFGDHFETYRLKKVFRTQSSNLNKLFTDTRQKVLDSTDNPINKLAVIRQEICELADEKDISGIGNGKLNCQGNTFILFRKNVDVLLEASKMGTMPHRIRMSGLPNIICPWVGACLSEHTKPSLTRKEFVDYWIAGVEGTPLENGIHLDEAWKKLRDLAGESDKIVDMNDLRKKLGLWRPPADFCLPEIGNRGPVIATIHGSKGREADSIYLMLPSQPSGGRDDIDYDEEARIIFVGATRARKWLGVGSENKSYFPNKVEPSGRFYKPLGYNTGCVQVQVGLTEDITASCIAGQNYYDDADTIRINQERMHDLAKEIRKANALIDPSDHHIYRLVLEGDEEDIATLSQEAFSEDLSKIAQWIGNRKTPKKIHNINAYGVRTIVLPHGSSECNNIYLPWAKSGIILAPVVIGYTKEKFPDNY